MAARHGITNSARNIFEKIYLKMENSLLDSPRYVNKDARALASFDVRKFAQIIAAKEAAEFYSEFLYNTVFFDNNLDHLGEIVRRASDLSSGSFLEFGVASGRTIRLIAKICQREVVGFDWFKGLRVHWR